ncbi:MAG TPA: SusC/RagA family TonB-linked outer membrane protein [Hymenobacter sp.]|uniref:SusC/RagA family TonB-linked outer membrane protein n=1 Tax=Hymenobacter sp. TaxID=1898978 RepID=UPI002D8038B8|nr:SusC/RagA family TonB-linked outer membrane protein [Hymenobacter sp.]HET9502323.1 SusC/RagA family TonB-linked outer membrane protein [Hymenobacter sp.]
MRQFTPLAILLTAGLSQVAMAQTRSISGRVTDRANGQGLPGVTVLVKGTTLGTATSNDGTFTLSVPSTANTLVFSFIGFKPSEQPIGNGPVNVALESDIQQIGEVVVTGALGIQRQEREVGYATATLDTKELTQARPTNVVNGLAGKVSGLQVQTISAGINPQVRITLRGTRSITGNNEALIVIDGIISPNEALAALNPDDIASISILKGANAAALYGSQAANGAFIVTTKKGNSTPQVTFSHTSQFESIAFLPKFQSDFGPGAQTYTKDFPVFTADNSPDSNYDTQYQGFENQQYGPRFDGSVRPFGETTINGNTQYLTYEARPGERRKFFNNGYQVQNGVTFAGGNERSKFFASYQNVHNNGIVPKDQYNRNTFRFNASQEFGRLTTGFNLSYSLAQTDATTNNDANQSVYWNVLNTTVMAPLTSYKDWQNNEFATPNGYYNAFYNNPYWVIDNNRTKDRRNTLLGNIDLSYRIYDWLRVQYRIGLTAIDEAAISTQNRFDYSAYTIANTNKPGTSIPGYVQDVASNLRRINSDAFISMDKTFGDINVKAVLGNNVQVADSRYNYVASTSLSTPGLYNLQNRSGELVGSNARSEARQYSFYADLTLGYKDFFFVHGSGRNDNISILAANNRSYFYPGVDASLIVSNAIPALKDVSWLDYAKLRGGITKVSQPNLGDGTGPNSAFNVYRGLQAYRLATPFSLGAGFPFGSLTSFTFGDQLVSPNLTPENTRSIEAGIELSFAKRRISTAFTYYNQKSTGLTLSAAVAPSTGFSSYLLNAGQTRNTGVEVDLNLTPIRLDNGFSVTVGGNFNYNNSIVDQILPDTRELALSSGDPVIVAIEGQSLPVLRGSYYARDPQGRVILNRTDTGHGIYYFPGKAADQKIFGNTVPKYRYGFNANVTYKGLVLSAQGEYRTGYVIYHGIGSDLDFTGSGARSVTYDRQDFVFPNSVVASTDASGNVTYTPTTSQQLTAGGSEFWANDAYNRTVAENYITKGDFFKIRELSLSYTLPAALVSKLGLVKGLSVNVFGRNVFTWVPKENIYTDPEFNFSTLSSSNAIGINNNFQTPPTKFYGATLSATF